MSFPLVIVCCEMLSMDFTAYNGELRFTYI